MDVMTDRSSVGLQSITETPADVLKLLRLILL